MRRVVPLDPILFAGTPFGNFTAITDFCGTYELFIRDLASAIFALNGKTIRVWPLGTYGGAEWLQTVQAQNVEAANALGLGAPPDLASYDLQDPSDHASWFFSLAAFSRILRDTAHLS